MTRAVPTLREWLEQGPFGLANFFLGDVGQGALALLLPQFGQGEFKERQAALLLADIRQNPLHQSSLKGHVV